MRTSTSYRHLGRRAAGGAILAMVLALGGTAAPANEIGSVAAVNTAVSGTPPGETLRVLELTDPVYTDELIQSSGGGTAQFLFLDQTALTIAPNSEITLDRYIYDPARQTGEMALSMTRGVLRFMGGRISKTSEVQVTTPVATIGIRGGMVIIEMLDGLLRVIHIAGEYTKVKGAAGDPLIVSRASSLIEIVPGQEPEYKGPVPPETVQRLYADLRGPGGAGARTTERLAAYFGGDRSGSGQVGTTASGSAAGAGSYGSPLRADADSGETPYQKPLSTAGEEQPDNLELLLAETGPLRDVDFHTLDALDFAGLTPATGFQNIGGAGFIRGQLIWANTADLDLHLILPFQAGEVSFRDTVIEFNDGGAVGALDADNLGGIVNAPPNLRIENITVTGADVPAGTYTFFVDNFSSRGNPQTQFDLLITNDGGQTTQTFSGSLGPGEDSPNIPIDSAGGSFVGAGN